MANLWQEVLEWLHESGVRLAVITIVTIVSLFVARALANRLVAWYQGKHRSQELQKRAHTLGSMLKYVLNISILFVAVMLLLDQFGVKLGPMLAAAGVIGIAVGFGAQHLVQDITNGFFMMLDDEVRVGDVVELAGKWGTVERVGLRQTVLRDIGGNVYFIPNSQVGVVTNMSKVYSYCLMDIGVAYREDTEEVFEVIERVGEELAADQSTGSMILEPLEIMGLDEFGDSALIIKARIKVQPSKQWRVKREFNRRLKMAFDARNIEIPFPHRTVYIGQSKDGQSAPINVRSLQGQGS